jgi:hypothetical protein
MAFDGAEGPELHCRKHGKAFFVCHEERSVYVTMVLNANDSSIQSLTLLMLFTEEKLITSQLKVSIGIDVREFVIQIRTVHCFEGQMSLGTSAVFKKRVPREQHSREMLFLSIDVLISKYCFILEFEPAT